MSKTKRETSSVRSEDERPTGKSDTHDGSKGDGGALRNAATATRGFLARSKDTAAEAAQGMISGIEKDWRVFKTEGASTAGEAKAELLKAKDQMVQTLADAKTKVIEAKDSVVHTWKKNVKPNSTPVVENPGPPNGE